MCPLNVLCSVLLQAERSVLASGHRVETQTVCLQGYSVGSEAEMEGRYQIIEPRAGKHGLVADN